MIGKLENSLCPLCGRHLHPISTDVAIIPFILDRDVRCCDRGVPAEICNNCHEPFVSGKITDQVSALLQKLKSLLSEVAVVTYSEAAPV
jgi:hypothetical protein